MLGSFIIDLKKVLSIPFKRFYGVVYEIPSFFNKKNLPLNFKSLSKNTEIRYYNDNGNIFVTLCGYNPKKN